MKRHLIGGRFVARLAAHNRDEVRDLGAIRLDERALASGGAGRRHVGRAAIQLLHHSEWSETRAPSRGERLEPESLFLADIRAGNVDEERDAPRALEVHDHGLFDGARPAPAIHVRGHANRFRKIGEPERQIEQRNAMVEKHAATRFRATHAPSLGGPLERVRAGPDADQLAELSAFDEAGESLNVSAITMVVADHHRAIDAIGGGQNSIDATRRQRERPFTEDVLLRRQRTEHVWFVQMVGRRDHDCIELVELEQILDVREHVRNAEAIGESARLRTIVVAERDELRVARLREYRQMCELRDCARADDADSHRFLHVPPPPIPRMCPK